MATNSNDELVSYLISNWDRWVNDCETLMLEYNEWRIRCYSEMLKFLDTDWHTFKRIFDNYYKL